MTDACCMHVHPPLKHPGYGPGLVTEFGTYLYNYIQAEFMCVTHVYSLNFVFESGIDTGGPRREFFLRLAMEISDGATIFPSG